MIHKKMRMVTAFWPTPLAPLLGHKTVTAATPRVICRFIRTRSHEEGHACPPPH